VVPKEIASHFQKDFRRKKLQSKNLYKQNGFDDEIEAKNLNKKEIKKIKENFQDEEWEDWDRYYNH
jgi:hypothetical protein